MEKFDNQVLTRFERLWKIGDDKLFRVNTIPSAVKGGEIYPVDYCMSVITRLIQQPYGIEVVCGIRNALSEFSEAADTQSIYPDESLHISLLGCTQGKNINVFGHAQINKIKHICTKEIEKKEPAEITLRGIGVVGNQIFIQGFPQNRNWEEFRVSLGEELTNSGEFPISYEDKSPVHINIVRIVDTAPHALAPLHKVVSRLRDVELGTVKLWTVEFVITDFCVTKKNVVWLHKIERRNSSGNSCRV